MNDQGGGGPMGPRRHVSGSHEPRLNAPGDEVRKTSSESERFGPGDRHNRASCCSTEVKTIVVMGLFICATLLYTSTPCTDYSAGGLAQGGDASPDGAVLGIENAVSSSVSSSLQLSEVALRHTRPSVTSAESGRPNLDRCSYTSATHKTKRQFEIVLLSTYPRSGNTWLRLLLHGATQILDRGLFTNPDNMDQLDQLVEFSECPVTRCAPRTVANFITRTLAIHPDPGNREITEVFVAGGINPTPHPVSCVDEMTLAKSSNEWQTTPASVSVKSHYPAATPQEHVKNWTEHVSKVVHTVRNPFDNIASRYLGNAKSDPAFAKRFKALENARKRNQTTPDFVKFVANEVRDYVKFHEYWLARRTVDAARGISTFYTRYESMCINTKEVVTAVTRFGGWKMQQASFKCALDSQPCSVPSAESFPQHIDLFNDKQIDNILAKTAHLSVVFGYQFDLMTNKLKLVTPQIPMCNGV